MNPQVTDLNGRGGMIRTFDPLLPKPTAYDPKSHISIGSSIAREESEKFQIRQITADSCQGSALSRHKYDTMSLAEAIALIGAVLAVAFAILVSTV